MSQHFSRTERHILGALYKLDDMLLSLQFQVLSGTVRHTSGIFRAENQEPTEGCSQKDPHPEVGVISQTFEPDKTSYTCLPSSKTVTLNRKFV